MLALFAVLLFMTRKKLANKDGSVRKKKKKKKEKGGWFFLFLGPKLKLDDELEARTKGYR